MIPRIQKFILIADEIFLHPWVVRLRRHLLDSDGKVLAGLIIAVGLILRLLPYLHNRSLWLDESWLAANILEKSFSQLTGLLDYKQMAPIGFLFIEKFFVLTLGDSEYVLRLFPLLAGILSLFLFYGVARRVLTFRGLIIAIGFFALSPHLLRYASELKQYSSDVTIALIISLLGLICVEKDTKFIRSVFLFSITGALFVWLSHPAIFSLAGVGIALVLYCFNKQKWQYVAWLSLPAFAWLGNFIYNYLITQNLVQGSKIEKAWSGGSAYMPLIPNSMQDLLWYQENFLRMFVNPVGLPFNGLAALCFFVGWIAMFFEKRYAFYLLTLPIGFTLFASGLHKYPFDGRLILFLVPAMLIFISEGIDRIINLTKQKGKIVWISLCVLLFLYPAYNAIATILDPGRMEREEVRPVMKYLGHNYQEGDKVYVYPSSEVAFLYYRKRLGLEYIDYQVGVKAKNNWHDYAVDLQNLRGNARLWLLFSHVHKSSGIDEEKYFLHILNDMGEQIDSFKSTGASIYLYSLQETLTD